MFREFYISQAVSDWEDFCSEYAPTITPYATHGLAAALLHDEEFDSMDQKGRQHLPVVHRRVYWSLCGVVLQITASVLGVRNPTYSFIRYC